MTQRSLFAKALVVLAGVTLLAGSEVGSARVLEQAPDGAAAIQFVRSFFAAFDARDMKAIEAAFEPGATIVHDDGVITTVPMLLKIISGARSWGPRERELTAFEVEPLGSGIFLVTCRNRVVFDPGSARASEYVYTETWLLRSHDQRLRAVRSHYSRVTQAEHSEDDNQ